MRFLLLSALFGVMAVAAEQFSPSDVMILGDIDYGQTSPELNCPGKPKVCALVFNADPNDKVEVGATGGTGKLLIALADGALKELSRGAGKLVFQLPASDGPVTYYIIFRDESGPAVNLKVALKKI